MAMFVVQTIVIQMNGQVNGSINWTHAPDLRRGVVNADFEMRCKPTESASLCYQLYDY